MKSTCNLGTDLNRAKVGHSSDMINDTLVSAISVLVKKIFTKNCSDVHYFLTDFSRKGFGTSKPG